MADIGYSDGTLKPLAGSISREPNPAHPMYFNVTDTEGEFIEVSFFGNVVADLEERGLTIDSVFHALNDATYDALTNRTTATFERGDFVYEVGETYSCEFTESVPAPSWSSPPTVSGTARVGETLTATGGTIVDGTADGWVWLRDDTPISGATSSTYVLTLSDLDAMVGPRQLAVGPGGAAHADATPVGPVEPAVAPGEYLLALANSEESRYEITNAAAFPGATFSWELEGGGIIPGETGTTLDYSEVPTGYAVRPIATEGEDVTYGPWLMASDEGDVLLDIDPAAITDETDIEDLGFEPFEVDTDTPGAVQVKNDTIATVSEIVSDAPGSNIYVYDVGVDSYIIEAETYIAQEWTGSFDEGLVIFAPLHKLSWASARGLRIDVRQSTAYLLKRYTESEQIILNLVGGRNDPGTSFRLEVRKGEGTELWAKMFKRNPDQTEWTRLDSGGVTGVNVNATGEVLPAASKIAFSMRRNTSGPNPDFPIANYGRIRVLRMGEDQVILENVTPTAPVSPESNPTLMIEGLVPAGVTDVDVIMFRDDGSLLQAPETFPVEDGRFGPVYLEYSPEFDGLEDVVVRARDSDDYSNFADRKNINLPVYDYVNHWGVNLFPGGTLRTAMFGSWRGGADSEWGYPIPPLIALDGSPAEFPPSPTWDYRSHIQTPGLDPNEFRRNAITWEGGGTLTGNNSTSTVYINNLGPGSDLPVLILSDTENRIEFEKRIGAPDVFLALRRTVFDPLNRPKNFQIEDIGPATGSPTMQGSGPITAPVFISSVGDELASNDYSQLLRLLDITRVNGNYIWSSPNGLMDWVDPDEVAYLERAQARLSIGGINDLIVARDGYSFQSTTRMPHHTMGAYGNLLRVKSVIGAGVEAVCTLDAADGYDLLITQAAGGSTIGECRTAMLAMSNNFVTMPLPGSADYDKPMPEFDWTHLSGGYDGTFSYRDTKNVLIYCNSKGIRPWINVPWFASEDWVSGFIDMVNEVLTNPVCWPIKIHAHNELWNYNFGCIWPMNFWALKLGLSDMGYGDDVMGRAYHLHGVRFTEIFSQMKDEWGENVITVIDVQNGNSDMITRLHNNVDGLSDVVDEFSMAPYGNAGNVTQGIFPDAGQDDEYFKYAMTAFNNEITSYINARNTAHSLGYRASVYEFQQHDVPPNNPDIYDEIKEVYEARQIDDIRMEYFLSAYFAECRDRAQIGTVDDAAFFGTHGSVSRHGAWGMEQPTIGGEGVKWDAYTNALDGHFVAYPATQNRSTINITATSGQDEFTITGGYSPPYILVYVQPVGGSFNRLSTDDFTANNGTTIVLDTPLAAGDVLRVVRYGHNLKITGNIAVDETVEVTIPALRHAVRAELWLLLDGDEEEKVADIATLYYGSTVPYTFTSGQAGKVPNFRLKMWDTLDREMFDYFGIDTASANIVSLA